MKPKDKRKVDDSTITTDTGGLCEMLNTGRATAVKIGLAAGAKIKVGKTVLWNIRKIKEHIDSVSG